ncbi:MAG: putative DNA-binding domain-containing protein [Acidobacteriota bacterium]
MRRDPNLRTSAFPLDVVQRWLQAVIVHPGGLQEALASEEASRELPAGSLEDLVKPSATLTAEARVAIYHEMVLLRMREALAADYPVTQYLLGEEAFTALVRDYLQRYPSRSYTLNRLGDHLPQFYLDEPERAGAAFLHDLTSAELALAQAYEEAESPVLTPDAVLAVPAAAWPQVRLVPVASLRLLALRHPVLPFMEACRLELPCPTPRSGATWLAVWRKDYTLHRRRLSRAEHRLLHALAAGLPLGQALVETAASLKGSDASKRIRRWFRTFVAEGLFSRIDLRGCQP